MARRILGLDLGTHSLKGVWLESTFRQSAVRDYRSTVLAPEGEGEAKLSYPKRLAEALERMREETGGLKADAIHAVLPGRHTSTHLLELPFSDQRRIEQTLPFELEDQLPFGLDEVVFDHQIIGQGEEGTLVLVTVVRKDFLREILEVLAEAGLDPRVVTHSGLAYHSLFASGVLGPREPTLDPEATTEAVLDIGAGSTELLIFEGAGEVRAAQSFPLGGDALTRALAKGEGIDRDEAEALKLLHGSLLVAPGDEEAARLSAHLQAGLAPLVRNVRQAFFAHRARSHQKIFRIHLCGGTARLPGLARHLARELACEVVLLDPFPIEGSTVEVNPDLRGDPGAGLAMSLALQAGGSRQVNLRTGEFHFKGDLSYLKDSIGKLTMLAVVVLGLVGLNIYASFATLAAREAQVDDALCTLTEKVLGECYTNPDDAISRLKGSQVGGGSVPEVAAGEVLVEVTERLRKVEGIDLTELDIGTNKVRLAGEADSFDKVSKVVEALEGYACFTEVSQGQTRQAKKSDRIEFNVDAALTEGCMG
ncbi:MAG: pilus assembly protein PilM [Deltaproteobacteria bacterium]|nr:pilus assembly protein PilM [Deltaproteobacteria bacterium]